MNYSKFIALALLGIFAVPTVITSASTGSYSWNWTQCNAVNIRATMQIQANIGVSYVTISWTVPPYSYEMNWGCAKTGLTGLEISTVVTHPGANGLWDSFSSIASSSTVSLPLWIQHCYYNPLTHQENCSPKQNYAPVYGDYVTVSITAIYNGNSHGTTDTLKITS